MDEGFFDKVYAVARKIPYGRVTSYGAIAKTIGMAKSARMVGWAMSSCKNDDTVPTHRVVNRKGLLSGKHHFSGSNLMQQLLENEGVIIIEDQVQNFDVVFWNPEAHL